MKTVRLSRRHLIGVLAGPVVFAAFLLVLAVSEFRANDTGFRAYLLLLGGVLSMLLAARLLSVRVNVGGDIVRVEGVVSGFVLARDPTMRVVADRRVFGWDGLALVTDDGQKKKLPLVLTTLDHAETERLREAIEDALATQ